MSLTNLPPELIAKIACELCLGEMASLRLTNRAISAMMSHAPSFTAYFKSRAVFLTPESLRTFVHMTSESHSLGCALQDCTIIGIARKYGPDAAGPCVEEQDADLERALAEAFGNLKRHSPTGGLVSLSLCVAPEPGATEFFRWRSVWGAAKRTFLLATAALRSSGLSVTGHLDLFRGLRACSLVSDAFLSFAEESYVGDVFGELKRLSLSLSAPYELRIRSRSEVEEEADEGTEEWEEEQEEVMVQNRYSDLVLAGLISLISRHIPGLEELDLHWYNLGRKDNFSSTTTALYQPSSHPSLHLEKLAIRGLYATAPLLLQFVSAMQPSSLVLASVQLTSDATWASIFTYLFGRESKVTSYHLDDLREGNAKMVHFEVPGTSKFPYLRATMGPSTLTRDEADSKEERASVQYRLPPSRALGSPNYNRWLRNKYREFGPPNYRMRYNFVALNESDGTNVPRPSLPASHPLRLGPINPLTSNLLSSI